MSWISSYSGFMWSQPSPYESDPAGWAKDCIDWERAKTEGLSAYQEEILGAIPKHRRVAVRGPHGLGKTALAAIAVLWFATTREGDDWKVITTASVWRQLTVYLWPEIHKWARLIRWEMLGREPFDDTSELLERNLKLRTGAATAVASNKASAIEGAHADRILYILDEAKAIPTATIDAVEGAFSGAGKDTPAEALALMISTPGDPNGRFYDIHSRKQGTEDWWVRHVTLEEAIAAGRVSRDWVEQRKKQWGENSSVFRNRVLGEFASQDETAVIPLAWVEAAVDRWLALDDKMRDWPDAKIADYLGPLTSVGVDVALSGSDKTTLGRRYGRVIFDIEEYAGLDTMETAGLVVTALNATPAYAMVDVIGIGAGVVHRLQEQGTHVYGFNAGARCDLFDESGEVGFANWRAAGWWYLRELLNPANGNEICLPPIDKLIGDLTTPRWRLNSSGKVQIESKDDIRKRLGRSTDHGDAVMHCFVPVPRQAGTLVVDDPVSISPF